jgi:hypothetical protein
MTHRNGYFAVAVPAATFHLFATVLTAFINPLAERSLQLIFVDSVNMGHGAIFAAMLFHEYHI